MTSPLRTPEQIRTFILEWLADQLDTEPSAIQVDEPFASMGASSLELAELAGELEQKLGFELPASVAWEYPTIDKLAEHLSKQVEAG